MTTPQSAIVPDHCKAGIFIEADVLAGHDDDIKANCIKILPILEQLQKQFPEARLGLTIAFGYDLWKRFNHPDEGKDLKPFVPLGNGLAPATQHDIMFHIASLRHDINFALATKLFITFKNSIKIASETHGFRLLEERGLDGFVDGTENPQGDADVTRVGTIAQGKPDAGGSYVLLQKYLHNLKKWNQISVSEQEQSVGRSKKDNEEFDEDVRLPDSHLGRTNIEENDVELKIVRRSLPFGTLSGEHGLLFIAYCGHLYNIEKQLLNMFGESDDKIDLLLKNMSTAVSGAYYYAPSVERLQNL